MDIRKEDLPATLQAFELQDDREIFLAEQVVSNQSEIATFTSRYAGKLIKAKPQLPTAIDNHESIYRTTNQNQKKSSAGIIVLVIVLILVALAIYGYSTGWLQQQLHLDSK